MGFLTAATWQHKLKSSWRRRCIRFQLLPHAVDLPSFWIWTRAGSSRFIVHYRALVPILYLPKILHSPWCRRQSASRLWTGIMPTVGNLMTAKMIETDRGSIWWSDDENCAQLLSRVFELIFDVSYIRSAFDATMTKKEMNIYIY